MRVGTGQARRLCVGTGFKPAHSTLPFDVSCPRRHLPPAEAEQACPFESSLADACFLSHYKVEAGSDARYFNDLLHRMLQCRVFLDSAELDDLRKLFTEGLHQSDVVVLLCTKGLLTRPWCLLELYEARRYGIPVIPVVMSGRGFSMKEASHFLRNLETELERENPGAIGVIQE